MRVVPLTTLPGVPDQARRFSPDGEQVAFDWGGEKQDNGDIYVTIVGSSEIRRLTTDPQIDGSAELVAGRPAACVSATFFGTRAPRGFTSCPHWGVGLEHGESE